MSKVNIERTAFRYASLCLADLYNWLSQQPPPVNGNDNPVEFLKFILDICKMNMDKEQKNKLKIHVKTLGLDGFSAYFADEVKDTKANGNGGGVKIEAPKKPSGLTPLETPRPGSGIKNALPPEGTLPPSP